MYHLLVQNSHQWELLICADFTPVGKKTVLHVETASRNLSCSSTPLLRPHLVLMDTQRATEQLLSCK